MNLWNDGSFFGSIISLVFVAFIVVANWTRREERRARERKRRHAEFDPLNPGKMYNPGDYWELFK